MDEKGWYITCPHCQRGYTWPEIQREGEPANIPGMLRFLKEQTGESFDDWNITEAYYHNCTCEHRNVVAEIPEACTPDENGYCAPAYMILALHNRNNHQGEKRQIPLKIIKQTDSKILFRRNHLQVVK